MEHPLNESSFLSVASADNGFVGPQTPLFTKTPESESKAAPQSPYSVTRSLLQVLTPPPIPTMDIPPSPPGTVPDEINKKFQHFFDLKKQGVHFNEKLARSSALKNPSLLEKLMDFAGIEGESFEGEGFYDTTLPKDIWDPSQFNSTSRNMMQNSQKEKACSS